MGVPSCFGEDAETAVWRPVAAVDLPDEVRGLLWVEQGEEDVPATAEGPRFGPTGRTPNPILLVGHEAASDGRV
jgi:hypothetical protein